jgi:uncharacterized Ntn-hydrolase superfamily protein
MPWCAMTVTALNLFGSNPPAARPPDTAADNPRRPVATYSIVARDPKTGEMGVAVQSHWFSVGSVVSWAEAGVGAVATQSLVDPAYGPLGLELMRTGRTAPEALRSLLAGDDGRAVRQVAMIDADGRVEAHTGPRCIADAGHVVDADNQFSVQANLMANDEIWPAMAKAYRENTGDLADRLVAALEAAQAVGGDIRGKQSAALLVVSATPTGRPWEDRRFDLRVEDHPQPVQERGRRGHRAQRLRRGEPPVRRRREARAADRRDPVLARGHAGGKRPGRRGAADLQTRLRPRAGVGGSGAETGPVGDTPRRPGAARADRRPARCAVIP